MSKGYNHKFKFFKVNFYCASYTEGSRLALCAKCSFTTTCLVLHQLEQKDQMAGQSLRNPQSQGHNCRCVFFCVYSTNDGAHKYQGHSVQTLVNIPCPLILWLYLLKLCKVGGKGLAAEVSGVIGNVHGPTSSGGYLLKGTFC